MSEIKTVQDLIDILQKVQDKNKKIIIDNVNFPDDSGYSVDEVENYSDNEIIMWIRKIK